VLDEENGGPSFLLDAAEDLGKRERLHAIEPRRGLVEEQQTGLGDQRPAELDESPVTEAQSLDGEVGDVVDSQQAEHGGGPDLLVRRGVAPVE